MDKHIICSPNKLLELFGKFCHEEGCGKEYHFMNTTIGYCLSISAQCLNERCHKCLSSDKFLRRWVKIFMTIWTLQQLWFYQEITLQRSSNSVSSLV